MKLKKALRKYGGVVGNLATGSITGAFPGIRAAKKQLDIFHSGFMDGVNDNGDRPKKKKRRFNY